METLFPVKDKMNCVTGTGVDLPEHIDNASYRQKFGVQQDYVIYVGRIEPSKGCCEMFRIFRAYKRQQPESNLKLVLVGKTMMDISEERDVLYQGFVSEVDKFSGISGARALWLLSRFESLSIVVFEAMALGVPVIVNGKCEVLKGHCERSGAGFYYMNEKDAIDVMDSLINGQDQKVLAGNARRYVAENYQWDTIIKKVADMIQAITVTENE